MERQQTCTATRGPHADRARLVDALAIAIGCSQSFPGALPDGSRPDVARYNMWTRTLFIGEAKHTESSGRTDTRTRLAAYLRWIAQHVAFGGTGILVVCHSSQQPSRTWVATVLGLSVEYGPVFDYVHIDAIDNESSVTCFVSHGRAPC
jgi:hypothetical protein